MNYTIYVKEKNLTSDTKAAVAEYIKRLSPFCKVTICCACKKKAAYADSDINIQIIADTSTISSEDFAKIVSDQALANCSRINYFIGFSDDDPAIQFDQTFSISSFSLTNEICLIAFTEQLYRAYTINNHITYHK